MVKVIAVISRKPGIEREAFIRHWQEEQPEYVRKLAELRRYVQNPAVKVYESWPCDGVAELSFDLVRDVAIAFEGPDAHRLREHKEQFIGDLKWFLAEEHEVSVEAGEGR